ncbi:preprotein translocase subunit YajC [Quadrisphaera sp. INWT6]|uniref:preprotein translocase subunit YajC n=1 Tax=Quadrisphaera sp. INWT6 TaxID=2596917 RepID=UPI0018926843|nr:preprotein translocase subunit YajC [Quadrisphaera sp. INWT6]MBF5083707.1 preprotein translocase subunit YajC [Quadrisphaera sp. INWT6]
MDALILLLPVLLLLWLVLRGRKQQRAVSDMQSTLAVGQRVMTTSGLYARIVEVGDTTIDLEVADGVRTTWARAAVGPQGRGRRRDRPVGAVRGVDVLHPHHPRDHRR